MNAQLVGNKIYGEAPSGFSDAETSLERSLSMKKLWIAIVFCILFMSVEIAGENAPDLFLFRHLDHLDLLHHKEGNFSRMPFCCCSLHCESSLFSTQMSNYSSMDGVLYCKPHFEQLFKESGNFSKNFQTGKSERENSLTRAPSKLSALFSGTQDKCAACSKTVYPLEKMTMEGESYHKSCFKCAHGGCPLTHSSYAALDGILYCKHHFAQLFMEKGNYQHVLKAATHKKSAVAPVDSEQDQEAKHTEEQS